MIFFANFDVLRKNIDSHELGDPFYAILASCQAILGPKWSKNVQKSIFQGSMNLTLMGYYDPLGGSVLRILTFLRENIDSHELGDPSYAILASCQAILGPKWSKMSKNRFFNLDPGPSI